MRQCSKYSIVSRIFQGEATSPQNGQRGQSDSHRPPTAVRGGGGGMRLPSKRRLKLTGRASLAKMSAERQRLSFFLVIIFLAVFGLIVLAEVFFVDKEVVLGGKARCLLPFFFRGGTKRTKRRLLQQMTLLGRFFLRLCAAVGGVGRGRRQWPRTVGDAESAAVGEEAERRRRRRTKLRRRRPSSGEPQEARVRDGKTHSKYLRQNTGKMQPSWLLPVRET